MTFYTQSHTSSSRDTSDVWCSCSPTAENPQSVPQLATMGQPARYLDRPLGSQCSNSSSGTDNDEQNSRIPESTDSSDLRETSPSPHCKWRDITLREQRATDRFTWGPGDGAVFGWPSFSFPMGSGTSGDEDQPAQPETPLHTSTCTMSRASRDPPCNTREVSVCRLLSSHDIRRQDWDEEPCRGVCYGGIPSDGQRVRKGGGMPSVDRNPQGAGKIVQTSQFTSSSSLCRRNGRNSDTLAVKREDPLSAPEAMLLDDTFSGDTQDAYLPTRRSPIGSTDGQNDAGCVQDLQGTSKENNSGGLIDSEVDEPKYVNLDSRLFPKEPGSDCFKPIYSTTLSSQERLENLLPVDGHKQEYLETLFQKRGLTLHSHYPLLASMQSYIAETGGLKQPLAFVGYYYGIKPAEYYRLGQRCFRWVFLFVGGDHLVHEYDPEVQGWTIGPCETMKDIEEIGAVAASALGEESDRDI